MVDFLKRIERGLYEGTDTEESSWRVKQWGPRGWEVVNDGAALFIAETLAEAKLYVADELRERSDPEYAARQRARRAARRAEATAEGVR